MKTEEREAARELRRRSGLPIREIAEHLGVSKSSVSLWVRDIELTPEQHDALRLRNPAYNSQLSGRYAHADKRRRQRLEYQEHGRELARRGDPFHAAGCMLYWAEGDKSRNSVRIANSDAGLLRFFVDFLRMYFGVADGEIHIHCHIFTDLLERQLEIEAYWLDALGLAKTSLRKSIVNSYSVASKRKRVGRLPFGTCKVGVFKTSIVQSIYGSIQEYAGIERPGWVDLKP